MAFQFLPLLARFAPAILEGVGTRLGMGSVIGRAGAAAGQAAGQGLKGQGTGQIADAFARRAVRKPAGPENRSWASRITDFVSRRSSPDSGRHAPDKGTPRQIKPGTWLLPKPGQARQPDQERRGALSKLIDALTKKESRKKNRPIHEDDDDEPRRRNYGPTAADQGYYAHDKPLGQFKQGKDFDEADKSNRRMDENHARQQEIINSRKLGPILFTLGMRSVALTAGFYSAAKALEAFGNATVESRRELVEYNGRVAAAFARLDLSRQQRMASRGEETSGTTKDMVDALDSLEQEMAPLRNAAATLTNLTATGGVYLARILVAVVKLHPAVGILTGILNIWEKWRRPEGKFPLAEVLGNLGAGRAAGEPDPFAKNVPPVWFPRPPLPPIR